ncbi:MAG: SatD family protein, partial [Gammaproteobacteria bacterium]|nr:SatD family protein [Gammaproteobacteria bacterium]
INDFVALRDRKLAWASSKHLSMGLIQAPYAVTVWDEFQTLAGRVRDVPRILFDLHRLFHPLSLWLGIGIGEVTGLPAATGGRSLADVAGGEAFLSARDSIDLVKDRSTRYLRLTAFKSANIARDELLGHIYGLHDTLLMQVTATQWRTIDAVLESGQQDLAAKKLGISPSTVSRNLRRAHYWQMLEAQDVAARLLNQTPEENSLA